MLSTKAGIPIAKIVNNDKYSSINLILPEDGDLHENVYRDNDDIDIFDFISESEIEDHFNSKRGFRNSGFKVPEAMIEKAKKRAETEFVIIDGCLEPMPNLRNERDVLYIAGPSGAGKSTYIGKYIKNYKHAFPDNKIVVVSKVLKDPAFDCFNPIRIEISTENIIDNPIAVSEFKNCLVVFDDIDTITDKKLVKAVQQLRDDCMEIGRHDKVSVAATSHQLLNYKQTRDMINEAQTVTFFPRSGSSYHITNFLKNYGGMNPSQINRVLSLPSRWVTLHKNYPCYVFYDKGAYLLNGPDEKLKKTLKHRQPR